MVCWGEDKGGNTYVTQSETQSSQVPTLSWASQEIANRVSEAENLRNQEIFNTAGGIGWMLIFAAICLGCALWQAFLAQWGPAIFWCVAALLCIIGWRTLMLKRRRLLNEPTEPDIKDILEQNRQDFETGTKLESLLQEVAAKTPAEYGVVEPVIDGGQSWRPFRVERYFTENLRGEMCGVFGGSMSLAGFLFSCSGSMKGMLVGQINAKLTPDLLEDTTLLFLEDGNGQTLRVLVPNVSITESFLCEVFRPFHAVAGNSAYDRHLTVQEWMQHTRHILRQYLSVSVGLLKDLSHPDLMDRLDATCQGHIPPHHRPVVQVHGVKLRDGIALATALTVRGTMHILIPTGYARSLNAKVAPFLKSAPADSVEILRQLA